MGHRVLIFIIFICAIKLSDAQQWYHSNVPRNRNINCITILDSNTIVLAGGNLAHDSIESIYRSTDRCATFRSFIDTISSWIKSIAFADSANGFGVGPNGKMAFTYDGGHSCTPATPPIFRDFNKVVYTNAHTLLVAGGWQNSDNNYRTDSMQTILKSTDGGNNWAVVYDQPGPWLESLVFIDTLKGFAIGDSGAILSTTNGGNTWQPVAAPIQRNFFNAAFINPDTGFIVGGFNDPTGLTGVRTILTTVNAGATWAVKLDEAGGCLHDISFANAAAGYIVGDSATLLKTTNYGQNWNFTPLPFTTGTEPLNAVGFYSNGLIAIGDKLGNIYINTTVPRPQVYSTYSNLDDSADVSITGIVNTHGGGGYVYFIYGTDPTLANPTYTYPRYFDNDTIDQFGAELNGLITDTTYYWCAVYTGLAGVIYGDTLRFYTANIPMGLNTTTANNFTGTSGIINGQVTGFTTPITLNFEYGLTPDLGITVAANPPVVTDASSHQVSANLVSLAPQTVYYYRLTGLTSGTTINGDILTFLTNESGVGVQNIDTQLPLSIYPNPASNYFTCVTPGHQPVAMQVLDNTGRLIYQTQFSTQTTVNTNAWARGLYIIKLSSADGLSVAKVVVE